MKTKLEQEISMERMQIDPLQDRVFKAVFSLSEEARLSFVSAIVGRKVGSAVVANPIMTISDLGMKECQLDMLCRLDDGTTCSIEVQSSGKPEELVSRSLTYWSMLFSQGTRKGKGMSYQKAHEVWQVMILRHGLLFPQHENAVSIHRIMDVEEKDESTQLLSLVFAELEKLKEEETPCALNDWLVYLKEGWRDEETVVRLDRRTMGIRAAWEAGMTIAEERSLLKVEKQMRQRDLAIMCNKSKEEGVLIGKKKGVRNILLRLRKKGMSIKAIADLTGMNEDEISLLLLNEKNE